jgi:predicted nuclease with RNAse H fold
MNIISIDLPWGKNTKGRTAIAVADLDGNVTIERADDDTELLKKVRHNARPGSIVLLDIPVDGCENLKDIKGKRFRLIDTALAHQGIWIQPSHRAGMRGQQLKHSLESLKTRPKVYEIYPYAVYKFLAFLKEHGRLHHLMSGKLGTLLDERFPGFRPRKYKPSREKRPDILTQNIEYLHNLLTHPSAGLKFVIPLAHPGHWHIPDLDRLLDSYDACLWRFLWPILG